MAISSLPLFDAAEARRQAEVGIGLAAENNPRLLELARVIAVRIARERGEVTADDVQAEMMRRGYRSDALGNAAGSIFRGREWQFTGRTVNSVRINAHARLIRVWRLSNFE